MMVRQFSVPAACSLHRRAGRFILEILIVVALWSVVVGFASKIIVTTFEVTTMLSATCETTVALSRFDRALRADCWLAKSVVVEPGEPPVLRLILPDDSSPAVIAYQSEAAALVRRTLDVHGKAIGEERLPLARSQRVTFEVDSLGPETPLAQRVTLRTTSDPARGGKRSADWQLSSVVEVQP